MSVSVTQGIKISVSPTYSVEHSEPERSKFVFAYEITIENEGEEPAQLLTRHWIIKDALQEVHEVRGDGVVGEMPVLESGEAFTYSSWCPLRTEYGVMRGTFGMVRPDGETFEAIIAPFALMTPSLLN